MHKERDDIVLANDFACRHPEQCLPPRGAKSQFASRYPADELSIVRYGYDPEPLWIIIHPESGKTLCQGINDTIGSPYRRLCVFHPILWKRYDAAAEWIKSGCIAEIQESHSNLNVGFQKAFFEEREELFP
jgi:hypothetical protein